MLLYLATPRCRLLAGFPLCPYREVFIVGDCLGTRGVWPWFSWLCGDESGSRRHELWACLSLLCEVPVEYVYCFNLIGDNHVADALCLLSPALLVLDFVGVNAKYPGWEATERQCWHCLPPAAWRFYLDPQQFARNS